MNREDIIRMAKEADLWMTSDERIAAVVRFAELVAANALIEPCCCNYDQCQKVCMPRAAAAERKKVAAWMIQRSYATGHGDTTEDLLKELEWQIRESEREACAKVCEELKYTGFRYVPEAPKLAARIRARGEK